LKNKNGSWTNYSQEERLDAFLLLSTLTKDKTRPPTLVEFVEATTGITLDPWQVLLCNELEKLTYLTGQRWLIHAPPQIGKSSIVSQRFPAWILGILPLLRIKLTCYNITHSTKFSKACRDTMMTDEYKEFFPSTNSRLPSVSSNDKWSTLARTAMNDIRSSGDNTGLPDRQWSRNYESDEVGAKLPDGSWVGWTHWHGGGKHGKPEAIDWISDAYDIACTEEQKMVTVRSFAKVGA
jgi:hypothetical protein